ncbi:uncharacterized protein LOC114526888 [Dendronephthya gigantea]|uniref:uncharacterized protein LOC114526888 n=1 Tax=Dendronephthya gigantea TaxID=151771 RepID=UPI00106BB7C7|nr:uncharacterized protein LOC114526888 [Dendronephthya gigantea]
MKLCLTEILTILLLCLVDLFCVVSSNNRPKSVDIIDNFIGLAETNNNEIEKRNSIVDGGVFVPYKSTTIVYKSRLVPVNYGFVIKKETLKDNPALYKLGVKLLDEKVEQNSKKLHDGVKIESAPVAFNPENETKLNAQQKLDAKSNCVKGSKVLRLLAKLSRDINKIEEAITARNESSVESGQLKLVGKSLQTKKLRPEPETHVSGHKGAFENDLNVNKTFRNNTSKSLSKYWHCRRSHTKAQCAMIFLMKHAHRGRHDRKNSARHGTVGREKHYRKHPVKKQGHEEKHLNKDSDVFTKHSNKHASHVVLHKYRHSRKFRHHKHAKRPHNIHRQRGKHFNKSGIKQGEKHIKKRRDNRMQGIGKGSRYHRRHTARLAKDLGEMKRFVHRKKEQVHSKKYSNHIKYNKFEEKKIG